MDGSERLKLALDETRMLVLGAQVLLGFQLRGAFQDGFEALSPVGKGLHAAALMLMMLVVGLLIAPAIHHRMVGGAQVTGWMQSATGRFMAAALVPLALSLGLDMFVIMGRMGGPVLATVGGLAAVGFCLWFWFGAELLALRRKGGKAMKTKDEYVPLAKKIDHMLTEARVILPGAQALLGFQLTVVLTHAFDTLPATSKAMHAVALGAVTLCTILLMAPAAYHRVVYSGEVSRELYDLGGRFIIAATMALALGLAADVYVVMARIAQSSTVGVAAGVVALATLMGLWHVSPLVWRSTRRSHGLALRAGRP